MSDIRILNLFRENIVEFFNELIEQFPEEGDLIIIKLFLETQIPITDIMNIFNIHINADDCLLKKMVKDRNDKFFIEHNLFDIFGKEKVGHFKNLWQSETMTSELKDVIWSWVECFIKLGDAYMQVMKNTK